jgi:hypothetical protein
MALLTVKLTEDEYNDLKQKCLENDTSVSSYIRKLIRQYEAGHSTSVITPALKKIVNDSIDRRRLRIR